MQLIAKRIFEQLGTPKDLVRLDIKHLWDNHFRVNVLRKLETGHLFERAAGITDSFFVTLAGDDIVSQPGIARKYK